MIRPIIQEDIPALKEVLDSSELFPSEYLDGMIVDYFDNPESEDIWFTSIIDEKPISIGFCTPEKFTEGTFNLLAIAVHKELQGKGIGAKLMSYIESELRNKWHRILIVETSGASDFELTRNFYFKNGYTHEATLSDFWSEGDDKVIFWKKL